MEYVSFLQLYRHRQLRLIPSVQYVIHSALYEDTCLFVVPMSHRVPRTPEQRIRSNGAGALSGEDVKGFDPTQMPGALRCILKRESHVHLICDV